ncbi:MAG: hypothetical protein NUW23_02370, partial [Firmicutes bacterium]|nr:hypothetical protein [Bacillota bacterium]
SRRCVSLVLALVLIAAICPARPAQADGLENPNLLALEDHFLDKTLLDAALTTADIDTASPGVASLHWDSGSVALRPNKAEMVACSEGIARFYAFDGSGMAHTPEKDLAVSGLLSAAYTADGSVLLLATPTEVRACGITEGGAVETLCSIGSLSDVVSVERAVGKDFWILTRTAALYYAWSGGTYSEVSGFRVAGLASGRSLSFRDNALLVLDGDEVRYYRFDSGAYVENGTFNVTVPGARGVAFLDGAFRVLSGDGSRTFLYVLGAGGSQPVAGMDDPLSGATDITASPWRRWEYAALTTTGIVYRAFDGEEWETNHALSLSCPFGVGYRPSATVVSTVQPAVEVISRVRVEWLGSIPLGCDVLCEVSADGGGTWTVVAPGANTDVPNGMFLCYRLTLVASNPLLTPVVDQIRVLQIGYRVVPGSQVGITSMKARLIE